MADYSQLTDNAVLAELGDRIAQARLTRNLTQSGLAQEAGVHKNTVYRLEAGKSTQLTNLVRVLRALGLLSNLDALVPSPVISPLQALAAQTKRRKRASPSASTPPPAADDNAWSWGDEEEDENGPAA